MTPRELVEQKACTASCLSALAPNRRCRCRRCHGRLHGLTSNADVTALIESRRTGRDRQTDLAVIADASAA